jgi:hypothetical protein
MADIFLPEEGALAVYLLRSLFRCIRAEAADPARRGFYTLTYRIPPYSSEQPRPILCRENNPMWRVLVPLLQFACYCWLALGVFALISSLVCGLAGIASLRRNQWLRSFHRYHARAIQELTKPLNPMQSGFGKLFDRASRDSTSMTHKPVVYPRHARFALLEQLLEAINERCQKVASLTDHSRSGSALRRSAAPSGRNPQPMSAPRRSRRT